MVTAAGLGLTIEVAADAMLDALDVARVALEPTPIFDDLMAERRPGLVAAADAALEAKARTMTYLRPAA